MDGTPQDGNVFLRQAESRPQLGVIDVDELRARTSLRTRAEPAGGRLAFPENCVVMATSWYSRANGPWICSQVAKKARLVCEYGRCWPTGAGYESSEPAIFTAIRRASSRKN